MSVPTERPLPSRAPPGSAVGAGRFAQAALAGYIGVELISFATGVVTLLRWDDRERELASADPFFADGWDLGLGFAYFGVFLMCGIAWLIWQYQAHSNLSNLTKTRFRSASTFWILVPIASLFLPYQTVGELARAGVDRPGLRRWWWALYLAMNFLIGAASGFGLVGNLLASAAIRAAGAVVGIGAAISAIRLISLINAGLETQRSSAGWVAGPPPLSRKFSLAWGGIALVLTVVGSGLFGWALPAVVRAIPTIPDTNLAFAVGDCFNETPEEFVDVNCNEPHQAEIYEVLDHPDSSNYPGGQLIADWAEPQCYSRFESYTGVAYPDSALEFNYLYPTAQGWRDGDREVICYLFDASGDDLTEPIAEPA